MMKKWYVVLTLVFCLLTVCLVACGRELRKNDKKTGEIKVPLDISDLNLPDTGEMEVDLPDTGGGGETDAEPGGETEEPSDRPGGSGGEADDTEETERQIETRILEVYGSSLEYISHGDGTCSVSGVGDCRDVCVLIPEKNALGEVVTGIEAGAFAGTSTLTAIQIPATVLMIGQKPFEGCRNLVFVSVSAGNPAFRDVDGVLYSKDGARLIAYPSARAFDVLELPVTVRSIETGAFKSCPYLKTIRYGGTEAEWGEVLIGPQNNALYAVSVVYKDSGK